MLIKILTLMASPTLFFQQFWNTLESDLVLFFFSLFEAFSNLDRINYALITLISNFDGPVCQVLLTYYLSQLHLQNLYQNLG